MFIIAVNHVRDTILCPPQRPPFFLLCHCELISLSLFLSLLPPRYKVTYSSNHNFLCYLRFFFFFLNFRIISKSILHNHSNSIRKLNYDRHKWANTFLFFFFSSCLFFLGVELCYFFFFLFFSRFPSFFLLGLRCSFFGAGHFPFSFWGAPNLFFVFLVTFPYFLFSGALCFLSLSLDRLHKPLRNRFRLVLSRFSDRLRGTMVTQSKTISWTICPSSGTKYIYVA